MNEPLEELYRTHRQGLYSLAVAVTGSHQLAEDAVQNAFTKLFAKELPDVDLVAYAFRTVRNASIDLCRVANRQSNLKDSLFNGYHRSVREAVSPTDGLLTQERNEQLRNAIEWLPAPEKEAVVLKAFAELTYEQAGIVASVPAKTIATRYRRALEKLETRLKNEI